MKNWTRVCQEIRYASTGEVYSNGEWTRTRDRGMAIAIMASQSGTLVKVLDLAVTEFTGMFERYRDACKLVADEYRKWMASLAMVPMTQEPSGYNYAAAYLSNPPHFFSRDLPIVHGAT